MPIYEYKCSSCNFSFEKKQGFDAEPISECPKCQSLARRVFYASPIIFKGSGFYVTDHRSGSYGGNDEHKKSSDAQTKVGESKSASESKVVNKDAGSSAASI